MKACSGEGESLPKLLVVQSVEALVQWNQPAGMDTDETGEVWDKIVGQS